MGENIRGPVLSVPMNMLQFEFSVFNFWFSDEDPIITTLSGFQVARTICSSKCEYLTESSLSNSIIHHALLNLDKIYNTLEAGWSFFLTLLSIVRNSGMRD